MHSLVETAAGYISQLRDRGREIDELRYLPQDLADDLAAQGFYRLCTPEVLGGLDLGPVTLCRICETLARGNGSAAWCVFIGSTSQYLFGALPEVQRTRMLENPDVITSGVFADSGTAAYSEQQGQPGYLINGHWRWGSGCHNAEWISGGIHELDSRGEMVAKTPAITRVFFKPEEIEILDSWWVSGLRGSGSSDYVARDVWVSAERVASSVEHSPFADEPIYRFPRFGLLAIPIGAIAMGMARACIDEVLQVAQQKTPQGSRRTLAMRPALHADLAIADTRLRAARALFYDEIEAAWEYAQSNVEALPHRLALRTANVHALNTSIEVIDRMYTVVGGTSVFDDSCLQRHFRDVHVASQHMMVGDSVMELAGRVLIGLDDEGLGL